MGKDLNGKELGKGICQRKDGRYCGRYVDRFGIRRSVYSDTLASLKVEYAKAIYEDHEKLNIIDNTITLDQWYEKWLNVYKYGVIKRNTKEGYIRVYRKHIQPILGNMRINDISKTQIQQMVNDLHKQGYAYETPHRIQVMLYDMFDKALNDQFIRRNPAKGVNVIRDEEKDPRVMSREEQSVFFDCCKGTFYDNLFVLCVNTGIRPGESCAIERDSVDLKHRELRIDKTLIYQKWEGDSKKTIHIDTPKTKASVRTVPLNDNAALAIKKQLLQNGICEHPDGAWMLTGNAGPDQNDAFRTYPLDEREWAMYGDYNIVAMSWDANKELLRAKNEEYSLGITNPEYYVTDTETAKANFVNGNSYWYGGYISGNMDFLTAFYEQNPDGKLAIQPADYLYGSSCAYRAENPFGIIVGFSSTATEDEIRAAWMYLEWMSQEDILFTLQWGIEGENYTLDGDGNPVSTGDYNGESKQGYNNNADYVCPVTASRIIGDPEADVRASFPSDLPQTEELVAQILEYYNTRVEQAAEGLAIVPCMFATVIEAEAGYRDSLASLYVQYRDELTMCDPDEFDALYDQRAQEYLDAGYQEIIDERGAAYDNGLTTKLAQ